ncbi:SDR family NAD(P)-dependent oxidoreductase [Azospirillum agricola]|uniref:SDR family NAD(P)-dependent oxidoreductase n=1 Tax=Azospirillum agricola TaxID=1720247 RepID=UPI000A0EEF0F|nr:SDR family oxidoreductase [Azospirillum agricola]SMH31373.1 NAD(P)-dependent dehydrogenase, short-chain alcohol dehydrogenase family [Azospirillum lipoferum]
MTQTSIKDGIVAVTGAGRGIGADIAIELARRGFTVACLTRKGNIPERPAGDAGLAERLLPFRCDVTDEASLRAVFAELAGLRGGLTALVNNAGIHLDGRSDSFSTDDFNAVMTTNATAVFVAAREAYPHLAKTRGMILNMGSFFDRMGVKRNLAYCASKAAVGAISRCLAVEWAPAGIRVVNLAPGYILTDLNREALSEGPLSAFLQKRIPTGGPSGADAVARLAATLLEENIPFLTGETIYLDGGQGIAH